mmetsp:Transcript_1761/g.10836  ORF Transcript_1761/g.10836 Transcript_1761/m.10836 type:complete len:238 (-) Transcript_1761:653-1366(-)
MGWRPRLPGWFLPALAGRLLLVSWCPPGSMQDRTGMVDRSCPPSFSWRSLWRSRTVGRHPRPGDRNPRLRLLVPWILRRTCCCAWRSLLAASFPIRPSRADAACRLLGRPSVLPPAPLPCPPDRSRRMVGVSVPGSMEAGVGLALRFDARGRTSFCSSSSSVAFSSNSQSSFPPSLSSSFSSGPSSDASLRSSSSMPSDRSLRSLGWSFVASTSTSPRRRGSWKPSARVPWRDASFA